MDVDMDIIRPVALPFSMTVHELERVVGIV